MIIKIVPWSSVNTTVVELPEPDMVVDPRHIHHKEQFKLEVVVNGTTMILTRVDIKDDENPGWSNDLSFRVYSRNEFHYSFELTKYLYHGIEGEGAPPDATEIIVKDGTERIRDLAFYGCFSLTKITIPNTVIGIDECAFGWWNGSCRSLRYIQLPANLQYIGEHAFQSCSLEAIFIPPTVQRFFINPLMAVNH